MIDPHNFATYDPAAVPKALLILLIIPSGYVLMVLLGSVHAVLNWLTERASWLLGHHKGESVRAYRIRKGWL